jgi:hypothetical protein
VRRKFYEATESAAKTAGWVLRQIQALYQVESVLREHRAGPQLRVTVRAQQSQPIVTRLQRAITRLKTRGQHLPQSPLGKALDYALGVWSTLTVFLNDGRVEIDNNGVENALRPTALGKKNWLFIGAAEAGERSAIIYPLIESCRRRGLDPYAYLKDVLTRLPHMTNHQVPDVTPEAWAKPNVSSSRPLHSGQSIHLWQLPYPPVALSRRSPACRLRRNGWRAVLRDKFPADSFLDLNLCRAASVRRNRGGVNSRPPSEYARPRPQPPSPASRRQRDG